MRSKAENIVEDNNIVYAKTNTLISESLPQVEDI